MLKQLHAWFRNRKLERDLDDEMRLHLELEARDIAQREGVSPTEAERRARIAFGGVERFKEEHRDVRGMRWLEESLQDLRYALRALRRTPLFSASAILVLTLGIGASTAAFSAMDSVLFTRLPYRQDDQLVRVYLRYSNSNQFGLSIVDFQAIEREQKSLSAVGMMRPREALVSAGSDAVRTRIGWSTSGIFKSLELTPAVGRTLQPADDKDGAPRVVVLSNAFAQRAFGDPPNAMDKSVTIDGTAHTVVGVLARGVNDIAGFRSELWPGLQVKAPTRRGPFGQVVIARRADGVSPEAAASDLAGVSRRLYPVWASTFQDSTASYFPISLRRTVIGDTAQTLTLFAAAAALVLLIAIANVASLMLARTIGRWREVTVRRVLGASRVRLIRLLATESLLLAALGALGGLAIAQAGIRVIASMSGDPVALQQSGINRTALLFAIGTALLSGLIIGAYPVLLLLRGNAAPALREGDRGASGGARTRRLRSVLVASEFALTLPLLIGAGLLLKSVTRLQRVELGFSPQSVLTMRAGLPQARFPNDTVIGAFWARALPDLQSMPGVLSVGISTSMPPDRAWDENNFDLVDHPVGPNQSQPVSAWSLTSPEYFAALNIPLLDGRTFQPSDTGATPVVLVSRSWAAHYFPEGRAVGRQLISGGCTACPRTTVIGIVGDVKYQGLSGDGDAVYSPLSEGWNRDMYLFLRAAGPPADLIAPVKELFSRLDPQVPLDEMLTMEERLNASTAQSRQLPLLLGGFAVAALALAAIGIFGMLSYTVSARRREIGVRMALGARAGEVIGEIVTRGMRHAIWGAAIGLLLALAGTRWLAGALYDTSPTDPVTLIAVTVLLLSVALVACWLPARRASAIAPAEALRGE